MSQYFGINDKAVKTQSAYIGIKDKAHKILKMYIGVNGVAKLFYDSTATDEDGDGIYFYNAGNEYADFTGGWNGFDDNGDVEGITYTKTDSYMMISSKDAYCAEYYSTPLFNTANDCFIYTEGYQLYITYSFICDEVNSENCWWAVSTEGTIIGGYNKADSSSVEEIKTISIDASDALVAKPLSIGIYHRVLGDLPNATLKIYKVWCEKTS